MEKKQLIVLVSKKLLDDLDRASNMREISRGEYIRRVLRSAVLNELR